MNPPPELIVGHSVTLRRVHAGDAAALFAAADDAEVMHHLDWPRPPAVAAVAAQLEAVSARWSEGREFQWVVVEQPSGVVAGTVSCRVRGHAAAIGYFLGRAHWGRGLAREAAELVLGWLGAQPRIHRIWATADAENRRSRALLERLGLQLEGVLGMYAVRPNIGPLPRDAVLYAWCRRPAPDVVAGVDGQRGAAPACAVAVELKDAVNAHTDWKIGLRGGISNRSALDLDTIGSDDRCTFGRWLQGPAQQRYGTLPAWHDCLQAHAGFHRCAAEVAAVINAGDYARAEQMLAAGSRYALASRAIVRAIEALRREAEASPR